MVRSKRHAYHGLLANRARASSGSFDVTTHRRAAQRHSRSDRPRVGTQAAGHNRHPKSIETGEHVQDNRAALDIKLTQDDLQLLDQAFPPPTKPVPLEML